MAQYRFSVAVLSLALILGCGSGDSAQQSSHSGAAASANQASASGPSPTDIVSQFLDEIRRGGDDSRAQSLLTKRAQSELARIGHTVQPIGSPDARFEVTRSEAAPGEPNAALVHSLWREPTESGDLQDYEVVWGVQKEADGWRISGLAVELSPNDPPQIIDFEDGELMAQLLVGEESAEPASSQPAANSTAPSQASKNSAISR